MIFKEFDQFVAFVNSYPIWVKAFFATWFGLAVITTASLILVFILTPRISN